MAENKCNCRMCQLARRVGQIKKRLKRPQDKKVLLDLWVAYEHEMLDAAVAEAKLEGTWNGHAGLLVGAS